MNSRVVKLFKKTNLKRVARLSKSVYEKSFQSRLKHLEKSDFKPQCLRLYLLLDFTGQKSLLSMLDFKENTKTDNLHQAAYFQYRNVFVSLEHRADYSPYQYGLFIDVEACAASQKKPSEIGIQTLERLGYTLTPIVWHEDEIDELNHAPKS